MKNADMPVTPGKVEYVKRVITGDRHGQKTDHGYKLVTEDHVGLTKREHFAYGAMVALITNYGLYDEQNTLKEKCWEIADVMLGNESFVEEFKEM